MIPPSIACVSSSFLCVAELHCWKAIKNMWTSESDAMVTCSIIKINAQFILSQTQMHRPAAVNTH